MARLPAACEGLALNRSGSVRARHGSSTAGLMRTERLARTHTLQVFEEERVRWELQVARRSVNRRAFHLAQGGELCHKFGRRSDHEAR